MKTLKSILYLVIGLALCYPGLTTGTSDNSPNQPKMPETPPHPSKKDSREVIKPPSRDTSTTPPNKPQDTKR